MATWESRKRWHFTRDQGTDYSKCSLWWEYQTTADVLTLTTVEGSYFGCFGTEMQGGGSRFCVGPEEGMAMYLALKDWIERYHPVGQVTEEVVE